MHSLPTWLSMPNRSSSSSNCLLKWKLLSWDGHIMYSLSSRQLMSQRCVRSPGLHSRLLLSKWLNVSNTQPHDIVHARCALRALRAQTALWLRSHAQLASTPHPDQLHAQPAPLGSPVRQLTHRRSSAQQAHTLWEARLPALSAHLDHPAQT